MSESDDDYPQVITIALHLPQPMMLISEILRVVAEHAPDATLDLNHPEGWRIEVQPL